MCLVHMDTHTVCRVRDGTAEKRGWGWSTNCNFASPGQDGFLERPVNQTVDLNTTARLNCTTNGTMGAPVQWWHGDSAVMDGGRVTVDQEALLIASVTWSDIGEYTCRITFGGETYSASATLNITGVCYS